MAWTDHAAAMEEGVAARDDLRTSLGQPYVLRRCTELAGQVHARFADVVRLEARISRRTGMLLHGVLAATALVGVTLVLDGHLSTASLVTLFLVTTMFVGQVDQLARHLPDLQEGFGAVIRLRGLMASDAEPEGGRRAARGPAVRPVRRPPLRLRTRHLRAARRRPRRSRPVRRAPSSVAPAPASPRWPPCCRARSSPSPGRCSSAASTSATSTCSSCARRSASSPSAPRSWPARSPRTSRSSPTCPRATVERRGRRARPHRLGRGPAPGARHPARPGRHQPVAPARSSWSPSPGCSCATSGSSCSTRRPHGWTRSPRPASCGAADRLLSGRTGILVAHRLSTTERAEQVAVLDGGRVVQQGPRDDARAADGTVPRPARPPRPASRRCARSTTRCTTVRSAPSAVRATPPAGAGAPADPRACARATKNALFIEPQWGLYGMAPVPGVRAHRRVRRAHRLAVGPHRLRPPARRAPVPAAGAAGRLAARARRCCWRWRSAATRSGGSR